MSSTQVIVNAFAQVLILLVIPRLKYRSGKVGVEIRVLKGLKIFSELFYEGMGEVRGQAKVITSSWKESTSVVHTRTKVGYWGNVSGMRYEF